MTNNMAAGGHESFAEDPGRVTELADEIASGKLSPVALVERYLDRISKVDGDVQAWRLVDSEGALSIAKTREAEAKTGRLRGPLHGIPFGVKDIIEISLEQYISTREEVSKMRAMLLNVIGDAAVLLPAAPGPAPEGLSSTGDPRYIAPWTAIGGPIVTIPAGLTSSGLPLGCILASRPGSDKRMCRWARRIAPIFRSAAH